MEQELIIERLAGGGYVRYYPNLYEIEDYWDKHGKFLYQKQVNCLATEFDDPKYLYFTSTKVADLTKEEMKSATRIGKTKIQFGFRSKKQLSLFLIWKEYCGPTGKVEWFKLQI